MSAIDIAGVVMMSCFSVFTLVACGIWIAYTISNLRKK